MAKYTYSYIVPGGDRKQRRRRLLRRALIAAAVICVLIVAAGIWLSRSLPGIVAAEVGRLTNTRVETGGLSLRLNGSIFIDGLVIRPGQDDPGYENAILRANKVHARFSRRSLLTFSPRVTQLDIEDFVLDVQSDLDTGRWNIGSLRFKRSGRGGRRTIPEVYVRGGKLRYCKVSDGKVEVVMAVPVEARFGTDLDPRGYGFAIQTAGLSGGYGQSHLNGYWRPGEFAIAGGLSSTDLPSLERAWAVDVLAADLQYEDNGDFKLDLRMKDLHGKQAPEVGALPLVAPADVNGIGPLRSLQKFFARYRPTGTVDSITVNASGNFRKLRESEVLGTLVCKDVSVCDVRFPYPIDHLAGELEFTQSSILMKQLSGKHGDVDVQIEGWTKGSGAARQYQYKISTGNMILDEALYAALQPGQKRMWDAFRPSGIVAADYRLVRSSPTDKRMYLSVELKDVAASFQEFPYPLADLTGQLYFDRDGIVATNVCSDSGGRRVRLNAKVTKHSTGKSIYYISIDANDVPMDAALEKALPPHYRDLYARMEADGVIDAKARVFSTGDANTVGPVSYLADVVCRSKSLKLEQMPVVLSDVVADAAVSPHSVTIRSLDGRYEQSRIALAGGMRMDAGLKSRRYHAEVTAEDFPFNDTTIDLLPPSLGRQIAAFRPQGRGNLHVKYEKTDGNEPPVYTGEVECLGVSINHERLPYPLQDVRGTISLTPDGLTLKDVTAAPVDPCQPKGLAAIRINGSASLAKGSLTGGTFSLGAQGMLFTKELGEAMPEGIARVYRDLSPHGPLSLDVPKLVISKTAQDELVAEFEAAADLQGNDLRVAGTTMKVAGDVKIDGAYGAKTGFTKGRIGFAGEQLVIKDRTITNVTAEAVYDPNTRRWSTDDLLGDCYHGQVLGSLHVGRGETGGVEYLLQAALHRVDLQAFLQAGKPSATTDASFSSGTLNAVLSLGGSTGNAASRRGLCQVDIANMRVGKVSPLSNLLSVLSLNEPTDYTFERMQIDSYIKHDTMLIRKLDMSGRNVAFTGSGTVLLSDGGLNLVLTARGQRLAAAEPSVIQALTEGLGGAVVRMEVTGRVNNPLVETRTLPVIEDSLRILGTPD
jgi:hypothetical protein